MDRQRRKAVSYVLRRLLAGDSDLDGLKREASVKFGLDGFFKNTEIMENLPKKHLDKRMLAILKRKPMRTASGVAPIAVMITPEGSCGWKCVYCPYTGKAPKSYTGYEPAALRARDNDFDAYRQVRARLRQFELNGHATAKCDAIVMGGTFLHMPSAYKKGFIRGIYDALNGKKAGSLMQAERLNEHAAHRMVGLTIETRPDVCGKKEIDEMLDYGATKVELGVQHPSDRIYKLINRGHSVKDVIDATRLLKNSGFKVCYHIMPGLPGSSPRQDVEMFRKLFSDCRFRPDMLKIYPAMVIPGTGLHRMMMRGEYFPYSTEEAADVIAKAYRHIPGYVRVMRIQRDIPVNLTAGGVDKSNLREIVDKKLLGSREEIREIRLREAGLRRMRILKPELLRLDYAASGGKECFLSIEDGKSRVLGAVLRLRIPGESHRKEIDCETAVVRELHVFGEETPLGEKGSVQHMGFGTKLLEEAEEIARRDFCRCKVVVISAVGVREYYRKRGYTHEGPYMSKRI